MSPFACCMTGFWLASWALLLWFARGCGRDWVAELERTRLERGVSRWRARLALVITLVLAGIVAPLAWIALLGWGAVMVWRESRQWRRLRNNFQDYALEWRRVDQLPHEARVFLDHHTPTIEGLGFRTVGNYLMKPEPDDYIGRLLLSEDGMTVGCLARMGDADLDPSFSTLLVDGRVIETTTMDPEDTPDCLADQDRHLAVLIGKDGPLDEAYEKHREAVRDACERFSTEPLRVGREQVTDVIRYEGRSCGRLLYEAGRYPEPPPAPVLPTVT